LKYQEFAEYFYFKIKRQNQVIDELRKEKEKDKDEKKNRSNPLVSSQERRSSWLSGASGPIPDLTNECDWAQSRSGPHSTNVSGDEHRYEGGGRRGSGFGASDEERYTGSGKEGGRYIGHWSRAKGGAGGGLKAKGRKTGKESTKRTKGGTRSATSQYGSRSESD
jgi:hypothetical protein